MKKALEPEDACGVAGGDGTTCADCTGVIGGTAGLDSCAVCVGGTTNLTACVQDWSSLWGQVS